MRQNIYDDEKFSKKYDELREKQKGLNANDLIEIPAFRRIMPNVKDKKILDLGCGYGESDKYYKELGAKSVLGLDISEHMIEIANKTNKPKGVEYEVMAMEDISQIDDKFDIIMSSLAFHYLKDYTQLVKDIYNLLNDNGYLVFSQEHPFTTCTKYTENVKKGHTVIDNKYFGLFSDYNRPGIRTNYWFDADVIKYHRTFTEVINTLVQNGFTIEEIEEPVASEEAVNKNPKYINQLDRPLFLIVKAKKITKE